MVLTASHMYAVIRYHATTGSWQGETWQTGLRICCGVGETAPWPFDTPRQAPDPFEVSVAGGSSSDVGFSAQWGWDSFVSQGDRFLIANAIAGLCEDLKGYMSNAYTLADIRFYPIAPDGTSLTPPDILTDTGNRFRGTVSTQLPPDVAAAISTQSNYRGPANRGRGFLGALGTNCLTAEGLFSSAAQTNWRVSYADMLNAIRGLVTTEELDNAYTPIIWSRVTGKTTTTNTAVAIAAVRSSDEADTQRRRDRQRTDVYVRTNLA